MNTDSTEQIKLISEYLSPKERDFVTQHAYHNQFYINSDE